MFFGNGFPFCDRRDFIADAIERGAGSIAYHVDDLAEPIADYGVPVCAVVGLDMHLADIATRFYDAPSTKMHLIGITGTNGKSSVAWFLYQALRFLEEPVSMIGTLGHVREGKKQSLSNTTPGVVELNRLLADDVAHGIQTVIMEVSSHGLEYARVKNIAFNQVAFTNLSRDHLDVHGSMAAYAKTKERLFQVPGLRAAVTNIDDVFGQQLQDNYQEHMSILSCSTQDEADICVLSTAIEGRCTRLELETPEGVCQLQTNLLGRFNQENLLIVIGLLLQMQYPLERIVEALAQLESPPGRMQAFGGADQPLVIVDYAHTPDALEKVLSALRTHCVGELTAVIGCGGDRDRGKRSLMAKVAELGADHLIFTDDNPRNEDPQAIVAEMLTGIEHQDQVTVLHERPDAIAYAVSKAGTGDIVLVAGKGHEDYQLINGERLKCDDCVTVADLLSE